MDIETIWKLYNLYKQQEPLLRQILNESLEHEDYLYAFRLITFVASRWDNLHYTIDDVQTEANQWQGFLLDDETNSVLNQMALNAKAVGHYWNRNLWTRTYLLHRVRDKRPRLNPYT